MQAKVRSLLFLKSKHELKHLVKPSPVTNGLA